MKLENPNLRRGPYLRATLRSARLIKLENQPVRVSLFSVFGDLVSTMAGALFKSHIQTFRFAHISNTLKFVSKIVI